MADVAAEAHVSVKTVSRVVNHEPGVRPDTAERVRAVIERVGFRRRDGAATHAPGPDLHHRPRRRGPRQPLLLADRRCRRARGADPPAPAHHRLRRGLADARARRPQGARGPPRRRHHRRPGRRDAGRRPTVEASRTPVVYIDRPVRERDTARHDPVSDNHGGIRSAVEHLVAHGHRQIGFLGDRPGVLDGAPAPRGLHDDAPGPRLPGTPLVSMGPHTPETVHERPDQVDGRADPVTAVITGNTRVTIAGPARAARLGDAAVLRRATTTSSSSDARRAAGHRRLPGPGGHGTEGRPAALRPAAR